MGESSCVYIDQSARYGRILRTNKAFTKGQVVFSEKSILVSVSESSLSPEECRKISALQLASGLDVSEDYRFLKAFCLAEMETQRKALDCFSPSPEEAQDSSLLRELLRVVPFIKSFDWTAAMDEATLQKVLLIKCLNAHEIFAADTTACALYALGSKMRHSCAPAVVYTSRRSSHKGSFVAVKDVGVSEELTYSYISIYMNTKMRQSVLRNNYLFICDCVRCSTGVDRWAGVKCERCATGFTFLDLGTTQWTCDACCSDDVPVLEERNKVEQRVDIAMKFCNVKKVKAEIDKLKLWLHEDHAQVRMLQKRMLELMIEQVPAMAEAEVFRNLVETTESLLQWSGGDLGFLDSLLVRIACKLGRAGKFDKALEYLTLVEDDQRLIFTESSEPLQLTLRAKVACIRKRKDEVPELQDSQQENCLVM
jgi:hypothetical protein